MLEKEKKFLDQKGLEYLWSKINMQDYPNNDTLIAVINAIDEGKMDKTTAIPLIEQAIAGQVPIVKSIDKNGKPVEQEAQDFIKIPETTEPHQYLTTNENGEKVWENKPDIATLQSAIDTLNGTGEGSVRDTVADAVATIVANAPEDFDTLKEVADWIANDTTSSLNLIERVDKAEKDIIALDVQADWNQLDESAKDFIKNKPVPITDEEIDTICGKTLILDVFGNVLVDTITGIAYRIYVEDGKLHMCEVDESTNTTLLIFMDISTGSAYEVYVEDGKLHMVEVE